ncbi:hypothetical protein ACFLXE_04320 [Chloroflexota bacterium]
MPKLQLNFEDQQHLDDDEIREGLSGIVSNSNALEFLTTIAKLMISGDLGYWLSPRLMRKVKAFTVEHRGESIQDIGEVDGTIFATWLLQVGTMEPNIQWKLESLPNNGGIYRMLLEGGQDGKGAHDNQG